MPQEFSITLNHRLFDERTKAGEYLKMQMANLGHEAGDTVSAGTYAGLQVMLKRGAFQDVLLCLKGEGSYQVDAGESALGNITISLFRGSISITGRKPLRASLQEAGWWMRGNCLRKRSCSLSMRGL